VAIIQVKLYRAQRRRIEKHYKNTKSRVEAARCRILLLLNEGKSVQLVSKIVGCVRSTVYYTVYRFEDNGEDCIYDQRNLIGPRKVTHEVEEKILEYIDKTPKEYGWHRSNWTIELFAMQLKNDIGVTLSTGCISGLLKELGCKRRRPCQVLRIPVRGRRKILKKIEKLLRKSSPDDEIFYEDEADVDLNPKIGSTYMKKGKQLKVITPGKNVKRYIAGAMNTRTGKVIYTVGQRKNTDLFISLLSKMLKTYKKAKKIHPILDNYIIHKSKKLIRFLNSSGKKIKLHFLPPYSPNENKIERLWKQMHDHVTRNHKHPNIELLMQDIEIFLKNAQAGKNRKISTMRMAA